MSRPAFVLALALLAAAPAAAPASAQEFGGVPAGQLLTMRQAGAQQAGTGCRLSQTIVVVGVNRALGFGSRASQRAASIAPSDGCRPLVSTGIVAGVNLGLGFGSTAEQSVEGVIPQGSLATTTFTRGVNIAGGGAAAARQRILSVVEP
jgi:hypothetical protein